MSLPVVVTPATQVPVVTIQSTQQVVTPSNRGIPGPQGPVGAAYTFTYTQATPVLTKTIVHSLGKYPSVTVLDSFGNTVFGFDVAYIDNNSLSITFGAVMSFTAYLN